MKKVTTLYVVLYVLGAFAILAIVLQSLLIHTLFTRTAALETQNIKDVLIDASRSLNQELVADPVTGRMSVPSERIVLPANPERRFYYRNGVDQSSVWFIDNSSQLEAINQMRTAQTLTATFSDLNDVQLCGRQIVVGFDTKNPQDSSDKLTLKNTLKLADGRTAYIYQNACPYGGGEALLKYIGQMQSF